MSQDPTTPPVTPPTTPPSTVPWYESNEFKALIWQASIFVLSWLAIALSTNVWDWRTMFAGLISNVIVVLKGWFSPTIVAPFAALNKGNVQG